MAEQYDDGSGGGGIPWGDNNRNDYAKQLGEQVLATQTDLLFMLNRGTVPKDDLPRMIRLIQKDELLEAQNSQFAGVPSNQLEVMLNLAANNAIDGGRVKDYLNAINGFGMVAGRRARSLAGKVSGFLGGGDE